MLHTTVILHIFLLVTIIDISLQAKKPTSLVVNIDEYKEFKKLLKTKNNILVLFVNEPNSVKHISNVFRETADAMKGQATLVNVQCSNSEAKKLCKKLKVDTEKPYSIKHYKDGDFHKDYDRSKSVSSMSNFLRDPTGDLPWEEDPGATAVFHLKDSEALLKFLRKGSAVHKRCLVMFYAPWCGYCKILKPEYVLAAEDLKGEALLAAIDVAKPGNSNVRQIYNITGFPTLLYYEKGQMKLTYNGENKREALVDFMRDPLSQLQQNKEPADESWSPDSDVVHLTGDSFDSVIKQWETALVVFYAPWCGHCKRIKPEFEKAASRIKGENIKGVLAAVDATKEPDLAARFNVKGYPTLKYFKNGEFMFDAGHARQQEQIVSFIKEPKEPPPPPPPEKPWSEEPSEIRHLNANTFKGTLRKIKHALVMFYAPWCGHCKSTKPEFVKAADEFSDELMIAFGAVDCTQESELCASYDVKGYPTIKYFSHFDRNVTDYTGGRKHEDLVLFMRTVMSSKAKKPLSNADAGFGVNVLLCSDEDFGDLILSSTPSFVMFYASWCGHCTETKPAFSKLATKLKSTSGARAIAIDAAENGKTADFAGILTLPTFKLYASGVKIADYTGGRTYEEMFAFVKQQTGIKDEL